MVNASRLSAQGLAGLLGEWETGPNVYLALADRVRLLVIDGRIPAGTRLPAERELADHLGRSRATVVAAYRSLRDTGHLVSVQGSGSTVTLPRPTGAEAPARRLVDLACAVPPPVEGLDHIMAEFSGSVLQVLGKPGFDLLGDPDLRASVAGRYTARGLPTTPDQVLITLGAQHAIALVARALLRRADHALVESPTYPHAFGALRQAGARLSVTPVAWSGWDVDHLATVLERLRPTLAYLIPDFHNPTGASMPPDERRRVVTAAVRTGTVLVVDETNVDLDIERGWYDGPFARHADDPGHPGIVTIGSLSKSVWSGLRLGWIRAATPIIDRLVQARPSGDLGTPQLEQMLGRHLVERLDELLPRRAAELRGRRDLLSGLIRERFPSWQVPAVDGGLSLWVNLGTPMSSALALMCQARGVALSAGPVFCAEGSHERFVRLPFTAADDDLRAGAEALTGCWQDLVRGTVPAPDARQPTTV